MCVFFPTLIATLFGEMHEPQLPHPFIFLFTKRLRILKGTSPWRHLQLNAPKKRKIKQTKTTIFFYFRCFLSCWALFINSNKMFSKMIVSLIRERIWMYNSIPLIQNRITHTRTDGNPFSTFAILVTKSPSHVPDDPCPYTFF